MDDSKEAQTQAEEAESNPSLNNELIAQTRVERVFNTLQFFTLSVAFMSSWEAIASNLWTVFHNGGPQTLVFGFLLAWAGAIAQAASLAEMAAVQPVAGAMYHWTYTLASHKTRRFTTWIQGWLTWAGWISMCTGIGSGTAAWVTSLIQLNYPDYVSKTWHSCLMIWAMLVVCALVNSYKFGALVPWVACFAGFLHVSLWMAFCITLLALAPKNDARFVFLGRVDSATTSGWTNDFIGWNLGLQTSAWAFVGFDAASHLGEEVRQSQKTVPRVMLFTNILNGGLAWLFILVLLFTMGNVEEALQYPQPMLAILVTATGSVPAATAMASLLTFMSLCSMVLSASSLSRLTWSWAREGALPKYFSFVDAKERVPKRAVLFSVTIVGLLSLISIGSTVAFQVFLSLVIMALYLSYFVVILMMVLRRLSSTPPEVGAWTMGKRLGMPVNLFALVYTAYILVWLPFPMTMPITALNFNYSSPVVCAVLLLALGLWILRRHTWVLREDVAERAVRK